MTASSSGLDTAGRRSEVHLVAAAASDVGRYRANNQDSAFTAAAGAAVADGVGGGPAGDIASATLVHRFAAGGFRVADADELRRRLGIANWDIGVLSGRDASLSGMATTFTGIVVADGGILLAHVGDSRAYRLLGDGAFARCTRDDSFVEALIDAGLLSRDAAASHPRRNIITATMRGDAADASAVTVTAQPAAPGDRWLLCSDGVSDYLPDVIIEALLAERAAPGVVAEAIIDAALDAGSRDNVTAVVCDVVAGAVPFRRPAITFAGAAAERYNEGLETA